MNYSIPETRVLDDYGGSSTGPHLVCMAGMHGNEQAGIQALRKVFRTLRMGKTTPPGRLTGVIGNMEAVRAGKRHIAKDLNRCWTPERLELIRNDELTPVDSEDREQMALYHVLSDLLPDPGTQISVMDLHTTTANSTPFCTFGDTLPNRRFARDFPLPKILGLEDHLEGSFLEFLNRKGYTTIGIEGGQHQNPVSVRNLEAAIWIGMESAGCLRGCFKKESETHRSFLEQISVNSPDLLEVTYRHPIKAEDRFRMREGYRNFQSIHAGELLATDRTGNIHAPFSGRIMLPLYQGLGDDGFFIGNRIRRFYYHLSSVMRRLGLSHLLPLLPGVSRYHRDINTLSISRKIFHSRWIHLLYFMGYRRIRDYGEHLLAIRRRGTK